MKLKLVKKEFRKTSEVCGVANFLFYLEFQIKT